MRRKAMALKHIKRYETLMNKKSEFAGVLATTVNTILNKKNEVYTFFYQLKYKRLDIGMIVLMQR